MENKRLKKDNSNSEIRIINSSPPLPNQRSNTEKKSMQKKSHDDVDSLRSVTSPIFLKAIKAMTNDGYSNKKDGSTCSTLSTRVSFDLDKQGESEILSDNVSSAYNTRKKEFEFEEEIREDIIYKPCELDFNIAAQLIKDAVDGTDIDFKKNKICLM